MKTYFIKNVDCENCARKIENHIVKQTNVDSVSINLISGKMLVSDDKFSGKQLTEFANQVEDGVLIYEKSEESHEHHHEGSGAKGKLIVIGIAFGLLVLGIATGIRLLYLIGYLIVGVPVLRLAVKNILHKQFFDEYFLMSIATLAALSINQWSEALAVMLFYSVGEYIQAMTLDRTKLSITKLAELGVRNANLVTEAGISVVPIEELKIGDQIKVVSGERIPVDSKLLSGFGYVDTSHISGESEPRKIVADDEVYGGSVNSGDEIILEVVATADNSMVAKLIELVTYADGKKTKTEQFITRFSKIYTPIVVALAFAIVAFFPPVFGISYDEAIYRAVTLLVISCPCAFVLSVPLGYVVAIGRLAKEHILVKGSLAIDRLNKINVLAVDKTGTVTTGEFAVTEFINSSDYDDSFIHSLVRSSEANISHPIARSLSKYTEQYQLLEISDVKQNSGIGIGFKYGSKDYLISKGKATKAVTISNLIENDRIIATYTLQDEVKQEVVSLASKLRSLNVEMMMLTGDNKQVATMVGETLNLNEDNVYSELMPEDKLTIVEQQIESGKVVAFIGDGLNDAAVIKRSDLGIAMGARGSELSIDSSDIVISDDKPEKITLAIAVSNKATKIIKQNIILAFIIKVVFIVLGIVGITTMWEAVFSDVGVTLIAIANSMRIRKVDNDR